MLGIKVDGHMQERARRSQPEPLFKLIMQGLQRLKCLVEVGAPDIPTVYHSGGEHLCTIKDGGNSSGLLGRTYQVNVHTLHRQVRQHVKVMCDASEIGGQ